MPNRPAPLPAARSGRRPAVRAISLAAIVVGLATLLPAVTAGAADSAVLGTAGDFAVLGSSTVTNTGPSVISGELGVSPGAEVTGFPPGTVVDGTIHRADAVAAQARAAGGTASVALAGRACDDDLTGQDLAGLTLTPGVYCFSSSAQLTGDLTLNALGDPDAEFVFKIGTTLTTASASRVIPLNGADPCEVYFNVGTSATLGTATAFLGTIVAQASVTATTGASVLGRLLALGGAVTLDTNRITRPVCAQATTTTTSTTSTTVAPGGATITTSTPSTTIAPGGTTTTTAPGGTTTTTAPGGTTTTTAGGTTTTTASGGTTTTTGRGGGAGSTTTTRASTSTGSRRATTSAPPAITTRLARTGSEGGLPAVGGALVAVGLVALLASRGSARRGLR